MAPNQGGALWLALLVMLAIGFNFKRWNDPRNVALVAMQALGFLFFDILRFLDVLNEPYAVTLMDWAPGIVFVNLLLMGWPCGASADRCHRHGAHRFARALASIAILMVSLDLLPPRCGRRTTRDSSSIWVGNDYASAACCRTAIRS